MTERSTADDDESVTDGEMEEIIAGHLDETDYRIYRLLNEDGRMSDTELADRIGLSRTAARRRRKDLEEQDIVQIIGVLVLQEVDLAYADVQIALSPRATNEEIGAFIQRLLDEELIYEIDEYMGRYDLLVRLWHGSLQEIKTYVNDLADPNGIVEEYEIVPVIRTHKAWHNSLDSEE